MPYLWGVLLAFAAAALAAFSRLDRSAAFFPTVLIVVASYYGLFAVMGGAAMTLWPELAGFAIFTFAAILGFKSTPWMIAAALVGHGLFDLAHHHLIINQGVPPWWPAFCAAFDISFGGWLAIRLWWNPQTQMGQNSNRAVSLISRPANGA